MLAITMEPSAIDVITAMAIVPWARYAPVICGEVLSLNAGDFVSQVRITGCSGLGIVVCCLFPNTLSTLMATQSS